VQIDDVERSDSDRDLGMEERTLPFDRFGYSRSRRCRCRPVEWALDDIITDLGMADDREAAEDYKVMAVCRVPLYRQSRNQLIPGAAGLGNQMRTVQIVAARGVVLFAGRSPLEDRGYPPADERVRAAATLALSSLSSRLSRLNVAIRSSCPDIRNP